MERQVKPCGACRSMVYTDEGCEHWSPTTLTPERVAEIRARRRQVVRNRRKPSPEQQAHFDKQLEFIRSINQGG